MRILLSTFFLVFMAELGDKTQLTTMIMASQGKGFWPVFLGSATALVLSSFIGAKLGCYITELMPQEYIQRAAGAAFIIIGGVLLAGKF